MEQRALTRREFLVLAGSGLMATGALGPQVVLAQSTTIRQGYQTNIWGMPTYYLLRSGALEKRRLKFEEFAVPSGNLTMQQVVKSARVMARKELNITKVEQLRGLKIGNQVGFTTGNTFVDIIAPKAGLKKEDYQEVKMNVNEMVAAAAAKSIDAFISVDPYCSIAEAEGIATTVVSLYDYDPMPVFMAATPEFVEKNPGAVVEYLKAWLDVGKDFKQNPGKTGEVIYTFFTSKGYKMSRETFGKAMANVEVEPGFPANVRSYLQQIAEGLLKERKISAIPDWNKALRPQFMEKARA